MALGMRKPCQPAELLEMREKGPTPQRYTHRIE